MLDVAADCLEVTAPGLALPKNLEFHSYVRQSESAKKSKQPKYATDTELLLHSTSHHNLDYTAREERHSGSKPLLNHFLGIFDPKTGDMQVIEAKKMIVRGTVRAKQASAESMGRRDAQKVGVLAWQILPWYFPVLIHNRL